MRKLTCNVKDCFLCRHCLAEWRLLIALNKTTQLFKKGRPIFVEGEPMRGIYFIYSGWVKIHKQWKEPKELIVRFASLGEMIGHRGMGEGQTYPVSATPIQDTVACFVPWEFLESSLRMNPELPYSLMQFYSQELNKAEKRMRDFALMDVKGRVAGALLDIDKIFGTDADGFNSIPVSRQDIASYAGTTYETVFKFLNTLLQEKIITTTGKKIKINDPEKLRQRMFDEH
ncbi:MAG: Crp/Fnr family transcriptional regulator [Bacteroidota bacterium]|nr:Crp/Fnr family transcriptional regulator [Bacteroidota bacterium]